MEEKLLEELQQAQGAVKRDVSSPLFMIREKEMEISGRVLASKQEAERIVAEARRKAVETINRAEAESTSASEDHQTKLIADAEAQVTGLRDGFEDEVAPIKQAIAQRRDDAIGAVVRMVTGV